VNFYFNLPFCVTLDICQINQQNISGCRVAISRIKKMLLIVLLSQNSKCVANRTKIILITKSHPVHKVHGKCKIGKTVGILHGILLQSFLCATVCNVDSSCKKPLVICNSIFLIFLNQIRAERDQKIIVWIEYFPYKYSFKVISND
jgi:hypothetical protein